MYYIYGIEHDMRDQPLYIGMSTDPDRRFKQHLANNKPLCRDIEETREHFKDSLNGISLDPRLVIYAQAQNIEDARELERQYIQENRPIYNKQNNQEGLEYHRSMILRWVVYDILRNNLCEEDAPQDLAFESRLHTCALEVIRAVKEGIKP